MSTPGEDVKQIRLFVLVMLVAGMLAACGGDDDDNGEPAAQAGTTVAATTTIIADLARNVAGDRLNVTSIIPPGADPHDFEPTPDDVETIADASLVLAHGLDYDGWARGLAEQSGTDARFVEVTAGVTLIAGDGHAHDHDEHEDEHDEHDDDPHVWFDVANVKVMTENIRDALIELDPEGKTAYDANAAAYLDQLDELDDWIHTQVATIPEGARKLVTSHEAFGYYVAAYGFEYVGTVMQSLDSQAQPSAQQVDDLLKLIEAEDVRAIFTESTINPDLTETIATEAGIDVVTDLYSDSLSDDGSETDTYIGMMRHNTTAIVDALTED
jgi:ABC-type Zn uptake system ZnuABC Zn-binding protein ZnuA